MLAQINGKQLKVKNNSQLLQGTVGEIMSIEFSDDWSALTKTAVFSAGDVFRDVIITGNEITIPWELLTKAERKLYLGFHGALPNGSIVMRTNIFCIGAIQPSYAPSEQEPDAPSPARADQIQAIAEQALDAAQELKSNAEAGFFDGADGISPNVNVQQIDGGHMVSITDREGTKQFSIMDGAPGDSSTGIIDSELSSTSENPLQNKVIKMLLDQKANLSDLISVDDSIRPSSTNPVQNKIIYQMYESLTDFINGKQDKSFFLADYGVTKASALESALRQGQIPILALDGHFYPLIFYKYTDESTGVLASFTFSGWNGSSFVYVTCAESDSSDSASDSSSNWNDWDDDGDHVTVWSWGTNVNPIAAPANPAEGSFLVWDGTKWSARTLEVWQGGSY